MYEIARKLKYPCYVLDEKLLIKNLEILSNVSNKSGAKILLALKGYAFWSSFNLVSKYLNGITASGLFESKLGLEEFRKYNLDSEISVFSPAFKKHEILEISKFANHIIFNSFNQLDSFLPLLSNTNVKIGLRVNPMYSEVTPRIYNPCIEGSRLGIPPDEFHFKINNYLLYISGLHFHTHCEQNSDALDRTLEHFEKHFGKYISKLKWINFGGGHHITREDYDTNLLISIIKNFKNKYGDIEIYLEPGEAIGWNCGVLIGEVVDIIKNKFNIAILDLSPTAHMPDCLEMPYTPSIRGANIIDLESCMDLNFAYRLGGPSCLAGDIIGDYQFLKELNIGDKIIIEDMIHYTIVKNNTFNGIPLPALGIKKESGEFEIVREFNYMDYKNRNG